MQHFAVTEIDIDECFRDARMNDKMRPNNAVVALLGDKSVFKESRSTILLAIMNIGEIG